MWKYCNRLPFLRSHYTIVLLVVLVVLFLMQRCGLILYGYSHIAHPSFDETVSGVLACDLLDDAMRAPLFVYQGLARSGDSLIEGFLLVPFFKLWGRTLFSLKLLTLCSAFFSLLCWITLMRRYQGMWAAIIFASLFAFPPPMFARLNLIGSFASHHLVNPFIAVQLLVLFRIVEGDATGRLPWMWFGFGLLAGLGTFTFYTYIVFNSFCILFLIIARPRTITVSRTFLFFGGAITGFLPWIIRSLFSGAGGSYLVSILKRITIDFWSFIQNFCFILPHSLGYSYPSRDMGIIAPLFVLFIVLMGGVIIAGMIYKHPPLPLGAVQKKCDGIPVSRLQGIFFICFPVFFLSCLSLSSLLIGPVPFEYWPRIGFFGYFSTGDVYRYRWLYPLYPFYFGICAVGVSICFNVMHKTKAVKFIAASVLMFFLCWGLVSGVKLYSKNDSGKIFSYKGYDYDQMAHRFILSDMNPLPLEEAALFTSNYPPENRGNAYRCFGTAVALGLRKDPSRGKGIEQFIKEVPSPYLNDFIFGVVRAQHKFTGRAFQPIKDVLVEKHPRIFYEEWGFLTLGYQYYDLFLNREKILHAIPVMEKWFFKDYLELLKQNTPGHDPGVALDALVNEVMKVPTRYRPEVVSGLGRLVGAEMLFDPMETADYPLDSRLGERFTQGTFTDAFYEGVGSGFAETLARFWRTLLLPDNPEDPRYRAMLDMEWERCASLLAALSPEHVPLIKQGFVRALHQKSFDDGIRKYLNRKLAKWRPPLS